MGMGTSISWCDHSWNPWQGCIRVSPGCTNCYAETLSKRWGKDIWGPGSKRERTSAANWAKPLQWQKKAQKEDRRYKVFCASMADVFEDNDQLIDWRLDLFDLVKATPMLDWQILTKCPDVARLFFKLRSDYLLPNIWLGTSIENQEYADRRIPELLKVPAKVRFLIVEPLLGPINLDPYFWHNGIGFRLDNSPEWVIVGGESGHNARPFYLGWARDLIRQCQAANVPVFMKQLGNNQAGDGYDPAVWPKVQFFGRFTDDKKGGNPDEWPEELRVREYPLC